MARARVLRTILCLPCTGVGGGIILDGESGRGPMARAGELGHTTVDPFGGVKVWVAAMSDVIEVYASGTAIVRMAREGLALHQNSGLGSTATTN